MSQEQLVLLEIILVLAVENLNLIILKLIHNKSAVTQICYLLEHFLY